MFHLLVPSAKSADQGGQRQQRPDRNRPRRTQERPRRRRRRQVGGGPGHGPPFLGWQEDDDVVSEARGARGNEGKAATGEWVGWVDDRDAIGCLIYQ
jgi:hypothetical protein